MQSRFHVKHKLSPAYGATLPPACFSDGHVHSATDDSDWAASVYPSAKMWADSSNAVPYASDQIAARRDVWSRSHSFHGSFFAVVA